MENTLPRYRTRYWPDIEEPYFSQTSTETIKEPVWP